MNAAALLWTMAFALASFPADAGSWHEVVASPYILPGGIADPAGRNGFIANAAGGIVAVDLRDGKVLWQSTAIRHPIVITGERLYASALTPTGQLCVVGLDATRNGDVVFRSDAIVLPADTASRVLTLRWTTGKDHLRILWETAGSSHPTGGAIVDLRTGHVQPLTNAADSTPKAPAALEKRVVRWEGVVGDTYKALVLEDTAVGQQLVLYGWNSATGQPLPPKPLLQGKRLLVRATLNGQHLCLRDALPSPDQKLERHGHHAWSIFDASTGNLVAHLPYEPGTQAIAVIGLRAYYLVAGGVPGSVGQPFVSPRVLRALDLTTGATIWERPAEGKRLTPVGT
jgi:outer membrane protein assembly factor BamB